MKRITALLLALVMCFALCACGSTPDPNLKEEDLAGTWSPSLWFLSTQLKLNSDGTYDYGEEKGTFGVLINLLKSQALIKKSYRQKKSIAKQRRQNGTLGRLK